MYLSQTTNVLTVQTLAVSWLAHVGTNRVHVSVLVRVFVVSVTVSLSFF